MTTLQIAVDLVIKRSDPSRINDVFVKYILVKRWQWFFCIRKAKYYIIYTFCIRQARRETVLFPINNKSMETNLKWKLNTKLKLNT